MPHRGRGKLQLFLIALALTSIEPPVRPMTVEVIRDPITDHVRAYATVRERRDRLVVHCEPSEYDGPRISFHSERWLLRGNLFTGERPVIYRFDDREPRRTLWDVNNRRGLLTGRRRVETFLANLMTAEKLVIRTRDIEQHQLDMTFRLKDVRPAVEQALAACEEEARSDS
jgi:hypothetical protein